MDKSISVCRGRGVSIPHFKCHSFQKCICTFSRIINIASFFQKLTCTAFRNARVPVLEMNMHLFRKYNSFRNNEAPLLEIHMYLFQKCVCTFMRIINISIFPEFNSYLFYKCICTCSRNLHVTFLQLDRNRF